MHQEVGFTPVMKVTKVFVVYWDLLGAIKRETLKYMFHVCSFKLLLSNVAHKMNENKYLFNT